MNRCVLAACMVLGIFACACSEPLGADVKVIVGATLLDGDNPPVPHSVIVVRGDRISAVGPQQIDANSPGSEKVNGLGKFVIAANRGTRLRARRLR